MIDNTAQVSTWRKNVIFHTGRTKAMPRLAIRVKYQRGGDMSLMPFKIYHYVIVRPRILMKWKGVVGNELVYNHKPADEVSACYIV